MGMLRFTVTLSEYDMDVFEAGRTKENMSKSAYLRLLIAEHENKVPYFIVLKDVIAMFSSLNNSIKNFCLHESFSDEDKLFLIEHFNEVSANLALTCEKLKENK